MVITKKQRLCSEDFTRQSPLLSQHRECEGQSVTESLCFGLQNSRICEGTALFPFVSVNRAESTFQNVRILLKRAMWEPNRQRDVEQAFLTVKWLLQHLSSSSPSLLTTKSWKWSFIRAGQRDIIGVRCSLLTSPWSVEL